VPETVASGGTLEYACTSSIRLSGADIAPATIDIAWDLQVSIDGGWSASVLPPHSDQWVGTSSGFSRVSIGELDHGLHGDSPVSIDEQVIEISYRLRIERPSCAMSNPQARLGHAVTVAAPGATITNNSPAIETLALAPALKTVPDPSVLFNGPLDFGSVGTTASGPVVSTLTGTLVVTVSELNESCGEWSLNLGATPLVDGSGEPLAGAALVLVAAGDLTVADGGCDLSERCIALMLIAGPDAAAELQIPLTIELRVGPETPLGAFGTTIDATLNVRGLDNAG
jgi:hypothetical protein